MNGKTLISLALAVLLCAPTPLARAQDMTLDQVIGLARTQSVAALRAKSGFVSDYWAWRAYQASRLPSLSLYGNLGNFNRTLNLLQIPETGEMVYTSTYNMQNSVGLRAAQNISLTGGTLTMYSDLSRIDQFGQFAGKTWYAQPLTLSYTQPLFGYNQFKWDKRISPKEYERAKRNYMEDMEDVTMLAVRYYYGVMSARRTYDISVQNYNNTTQMLAIARERLGLGTVTRDEYLQLELSQLRDSIAINDNLVSLREAQMQLNSLLGLDESYEVSPVLEEDLPDIQMDYNLVLAKCAGNSSFELDNEISILNAESAIEQAKANRGISMTLNARFGLTNSDSDFSRTFANLLDQEVVGLSFTIPIFDWGLGKGRVRKAEAAADVIRAQVEQAENDKRISLFTAVGQFNNQRQQCDVSRRAAAIAAERYELVMEKFRSGTARVLDLNTARSENDSAIQQYIGDISSFWNYYYTLRKLTLYDFIAGADLEVDFNELLK
ncbi:MAG: TolC family protein [Bacteroidales bacterium]|nr:TolC family protein [Bacteroidales bacterium]MCR5276045.1 TolC family protein [Bacteroidales bacterium]